MTLDETINPNQAGHIADHQAIAASLNALDATIAAAIYNVLPLARCDDNPSTVQAVGVGGTTWQAVDATNLEPITFVAPTNGSVIVEYQAGGSIGSSSQLQWGCHDSTGAAGSVVAGSIVAGTPTGALAPNHIVRTKVTGLTAGQSYTWTWYHRRTGANGGFTVWGGSDTTAAGEARLAIYPFV